MYVGGVVVFDVFDEVEGKWEIGVESNVFDVMVGVIFEVFLLVDEFYDVIVVLRVGNDISVDGCVVDEGVFVISCLVIII